MGNTSHREATPRKEVCVVWKNPEDPAGERKALVAAYLEARYGMSELADLFGISRKTAYKYVARFREGGEPALDDQSRASHNHPNATSVEMAQLIIATKREYVRWGPLKILQHLEERFPTLQLPAVSTAGVILDREGLVARRKKRRSSVDPKRPQIGPIILPHQVNNIDFKGQFRTGDGRLCYPLTLTDSFSRALLLCQALEGPTFAATHKALEKCFREHGLPESLRSDNGEPFVSSRSLGGLSRLGVWLVKLGIQRHRSRLGSPQDNALHERMHRTLKEETVIPPARTLREQQKRFDRFVREYNEVRPHQALDGKTPSSLYAPSPRPFPKRLPSIEYDPHFEVRSVRTDGTIKWRGEHLFVSESLCGERVGLVETNCGIWSLTFGPVLLGIFDEERGKIVKT